MSTSAFAVPHLDAIGRLPSGLLYPHQADGVAALLRVDDQGPVGPVRRHPALVADDDLLVAWTPGAFELPLLARRLAASGLFDAVACLGAVIRGETAHFDYVAGEAARGIQQVALETGVPISFGVLTTNTMEQEQSEVRLSA